MPDDITPENLLPLIGRPDAPVLIDVSLDPDFESDPHLIPGAFRHAHDDIPALMKRVNGMASIVICQKGGKLSQGLASWLRTEGLAAAYLQGGNHAWRDHPGTLRIPAVKLPMNAGERTLWVTNALCDPDRLACVWLVRRFLDRSARILFVDEDEIAGVTERFGATAFEAFATDLALGGRQCRFADMVTNFQLDCAALSRIADILRDKSPDTPGVKAILSGIATPEASPEHKATAALPVFDALFQVAQSGEIWA